MPIHRIHAVRNGQRPTVAWEDADFIAVVSVSADEVVMLNSDGTETRLQSSHGDLAIGPGGTLSGTVTSMTRTDDSGATVFEALDGLSLAASDVAASAGLMLSTLLDVSVRISSASSWIDDLVGGNAFWQDGASGTSFSFASYELGLPALRMALGETAAVSLVVGSDGDDRLSAGSASSVVLGGGGNDTLAGSIGSDILAGGTGSDTVDLSTASGPVEIDLARGTSASEDGPVDVLVSIENAIGSAFDDTIVADSAANRLAGGRGDDTLTLGAGDDLVLFALGDGRDVVTDFGSQGHDVIQLQGFADLTSFASLVSGNHLVTTAGATEIVLSSADSLVLIGVTNPNTLTAANFQF